MDTEHVPVPSPLCVLCLSTPFDGDVRIDHLPTGGTAAHGRVRVPMVEVWAECTFHRDLTFISCACSEIASASLCRTAARLGGPADIDNLHRVLLVAKWTGEAVPQLLSRRLDIATRDRIGSGSTWRVDFRRLDGMLRSDADYRPIISFSPLHPANIATAAVDFNMAGVVTHFDGLKPGTKTTDRHTNRVVAGSHCGSTSRSPQ